MLWLCIYFPRLPFDALSLDEQALTVVTCTDNRARRIVVSSKAATQAGITVDMDYATASMLCADLITVHRNLRAERKALERLAAWAYQWSSFVTLQLAESSSPTEHSALWLEIAASYKLFGGRATLLQSIETELIELKYEYQLGIAHSIEAAALLARAGRRVIAETLDTLRRQINKLPLALLALPQAVIFELQRAGIRTIETFIDLPKDSIARRFGPQVNDYLDKLLGHVADPRPAFQLPKKYRARCELGAETLYTEALLFPLRRMLSEFQGYLRVIDGGAQRFHIHLKHRQGATRVTIGCSIPERNADQFFSLVRERLERLELPAPVIEIGLQADRFTPPPIQQSELFASARQSAEQFQQVRDKLNARLGDDALQSYQLIADHRPEVAWSIKETHTPSAAHAVAAPRPLWLLAEPRHIAAPTQQLNPPERIASGWWDRDVQRDYYFVRDAHNVGLWIYCDQTTHEWYLHGLCG